MDAKDYVESVLEDIRRCSPGQEEFYQAATEVFHSLIPLLSEEKKYYEHSILERLVLPERSIIFKVTWVDDSGKVRTNLGYRVQFNSALGPYKGGLRFHPTVTLGIVKFLGFEQIFKNALTGLGIGGGKGGSNFDPKGKSDNEVMRFCQAFMNELYRHIGQTRDVPAGDIGVGAREIGYLFGQYKLLTARFEGSLTGKGVGWGGSLGRKEATGYGSVYFAEHILNKYGDELKGKKCCVSGAGNVATYTIEKLHKMGAIPITCSDSKGTIYHPAGIDVNTLKAIKEVGRESLEKYAQLHPDATYIPVHNYPEGGHAVWSIPCDVAFPSATQNELTIVDAKNLVKNGCILVNEGANMPTTLEAYEYLRAHGVHFGPAKAANAGGVAVSQLEMAQNASMQHWSFAEIDTRLFGIMKDIFTTADETAREFGEEGNLLLGANIAGFRRVADAMIDEGAV
ncbi:NADP-specific glutamate dehydrogenase [Nitratifractor sp.]